MFSLLRAGRAQPSSIQWALHKTTLVSRQLHLAGICASGRAGTSAAKAPAVPPGGQINSIFPAAVGAAVACGAFVMASLLSDTAENEHVAEEDEPEHWTKELISRGVNDLDAGYAPMTTNRLTVVRKRQGPPQQVGEPAFTTDEVMTHNKLEDMWVTYQDGVYDVTDFRHRHPGGSEFLEKAAGAAIDNYWAHWHSHHISKNAVNALAPLRVGHLSDWAGDATHGIDYFEGDPARPSTQVVLFDRPWQTETHTEVLAGTYLTPNSALYVRNHAPVPALEAESHTIEFVSRTDQGDTKVASLSLKELEKKHGLRDITSILQCTGNRAADNIAANGPSGFSGCNDENIQCGMLGNIRWSGISMTSVLTEHLGVTADSIKGLTEGPEAMHVEFHGADGYYTAVPLALLIDPTNDCLLATHQNGDPLLPDHGYPVRTLLPGVAGARNVKWVHRIVLQKGEGISPWNKTYYKNTSEPFQSDGRRPSHFRLPLNSLIMSATSSGESVHVEGVAYPGASGEEIAGVEISADLGTTWHPMQLRQAESETHDDSTKHWHWVRWYGTIEKGAGKEVWCRASTVKGSVQPEHPPQRGGFLYDGWHKVTVTE